MTRDAIAALLREAGAAHHEAFRHVNGEDAEWPRWYAEFLVQRLGVLLRRDLTVDGLAADLQALEDERQRRAPGADWPEFYAEGLLRR
jgi:hypothetical protein